MRRSVAPIYALILLQTLVWIAIVPLTPAFADEFGLSGFQTGMILAAASLAVLVISFPVGLLVDRLGARRMTIACGCVFTLATLGQGLANEFWTLLLARALFGVAFGTLWAAATAWLSDSLTDERRAAALAATATVTGIGFTVGPVAAGVLADRYDPGTPFLVAAVGAALVTATLFVVPPAAGSIEQGMPLRDGFRIARRDELVLGGIALIVLIGLVGGGINLLVPRQLDDNGVSAGEIGLLFTVGSAIYTVMSGAVARRGDRWATLRVGGLAALATGATVVLVLLSGSTLAAVAFIVLRAPFWSTMDTIIYPLAAAGAHRSALGRGFVMGLVMLGWGIASTLGPLIAGALTDTWGERAAYAVMILLCALFGAWLLRTARTTGRASAEAVDLDRLYGARDLVELRSEYDRIAPAYDAELLDGMGYRSPDELASIVQRLVPTNAHILDAGAGTGLLGSALAEKGFTRLDGLDLSSGMLAEAAKKRIYSDLREARLGEHLDYATDSYDAVVSGGVFTVGHAPASALDELVRLTRSGGHVIFTLRSDQRLPGFDEAIAELEQRRRWELVERGDEFQALPTGEPEVLARVWAFRVL
jgi:MFS family permease